MGPNNREQKQINPFMVLGIVFGVVALVLLVITLMNIFRGNPYGAETRIDNIGNYYGDLPQDSKDLIFHQLNEVISENVSEGTEVPTSGAMVREGTAESRFDEATQVHSGDFVVDVEKVRQSYVIQFEWSAVENNPNLGGYPVMVTCPAADLMIYEGQKCVDMFAGTVEWKNEYQISYTYGALTGLRIQELFREFLLGAFDREASYLAVVDETSLSRVKSQPDLTYQFRVLVEGVGEFKVVVRTDALYGEKYVTVGISGEGVSRGYVLAGTDEEKKSVGVWLKSYTGVSEVVLRDLN